MCQNVDLNTFFENISFWNPHNIVKGVNSASVGIQIAESTTIWLFLWNSSYATDGPWFTAMCQNVDLNTFFENISFWNPHNIIIGVSSASVGIQIVKSIKLWLFLCNLSYATDGTWRTAMCQNVDSNTYFENISFEILITL
jgi:hypothetical protein